MTPLQLKIILATAEFRSISNAAKALAISQPNASNGIRLVEEEVGFPIFIRRSVGFVLTDKGRLFLEHARKIVEENEKILKLQHAEDQYRLRLGSVGYYHTALEPFLKLSADHRDDADTDFRYLCVSVTKGLQLLADQNLDILVVPALKHQIAPLKEECKKAHLHMESMGLVPGVIVMRQDHPAVLDGRCTRITRGCDLMKDYPCIIYRTVSEDSGAAGYAADEFIESKSLLYVDEVEVKMRLTACSNAFYLGIQTADNLKERYGLASFPLPGIDLEVFAITHSVESDRHEIIDYIQLLRKALVSLRK